MMRAILAAALASVALVGCGGSAAQDEEELASVDFNLLFPANFTGNSVKLCGRRQALADAKYRCNSVLGKVRWAPGGEAADHCICVAFPSGPLGTLGVLPTVEDLCPSKDVPMAPWDFTFEVYSDATCGTSGGEALNPIDPLDDQFHNFECYDMKNHGFSSPNMTTEELAPGCNQNEITCLTESSQKAFDFDVCVLQSEPCLPNLDGVWPPHCNEVVADNNVCINSGGTCECGNGTCDGTENCLSCPRDCTAACFGLNCDCRVVKDPNTGVKSCLCPDLLQLAEGCVLDPSLGCLAVCPGDPPALR